MNLPPPSREAKFPKAPLPEFRLADACEKVDASVRQFSRMPLPGATAASVQHWRTAFEKRIVDAFRCAADAAFDPNQAMLNLAAAELAQHWFETQPLMRAAMAAIDLKAGVYLSADLGQDIHERLEIVDRFLRLATALSNLD